MIEYHNNLIRNVALIKPKRTDGPKPTVSSVKLEKTVQSVNVPNVSVLNGYQTQHNVIKKK